MPGYWYAKVGDFARNPNKWVCAFNNSFNPLGKLAHRIDVAFPAREIFIHKLSLTYVGITDNLFFGGKTSAFGKTHGYGQSGIGRADQGIKEKRLAKRGL
jgi:hypothetical protein